MTEKRYFTRYAHSEGMTGLSFAGDGTLLVTCGSDGDVRVWKDLEDDDPKSHRVGDSAYAVVIGKDCFYVSTDTNSVLGYTLPDGSPNGVVTRSTALFNHIVLSSDGKKLLAGSSDFSVKLVEVDNKSFKVFLGHDAPVLSVALDPCLEYAVSSSCDGSVRVWRLAKQNCIKSWASVFPTSNEFSASSVLCRLSWQPPCGKLLAVPVENTVKFYHRDNWDEAFSLKDDSSKSSINCVAFSRCGRFLAAAYVNGSIVAWNLESRRCIEKQNSDKGYSICSLEWNPNGRDIVFCDIQGRIGMVDKIEVDDGVRAAVCLDPVAQFHSTSDVHEGDDDDDENTFSISKIKAETMGSDDHMAAVPGDEVKQIGSTTTEAVRKILVQPTGPKLADPQEPFQSGSTPTYYSHRFMVWNAVGIIRSHTTDDENSIDVEFHDTAVHHSLHLENSHGHTMADVSRTAVVLACVSQLDVPSKLVCVHFATWDNSKEWVMGLPEGENIQAVAAANKWVAAVTDARHVRIITVGGIERHILELPGPVVTVAASAEDRLLAVAYHRSAGFPGDQCLGLLLVDMSTSGYTVNTYDIPLSAKATLSWLGFTDEDTPCAADSGGIVRLLFRKSQTGHTWTQIADTKHHAKGRSDQHFVVGLSELQQTIRCIPCKGSRYPATLPHPTIVLIPFRLPLCEIQSEKGQFQEEYLKQSLLLDAAARLDGLGYETDESVLDSARKTSREALMKLFALSCRSDHEFRSVEVGSLMDSSHMVQLAIRYASQVKRFQVAERLGRIAHDKLDSESQSHPEREFDAMVDVIPQAIRPRPTVTRPTMHGYKNDMNFKDDDDNNDLDSEEEAEEDGTQEESRKCETQSSVTFEQTAAATVHRSNPFKVSASPSSTSGEACMAATTTAAATTATAATVGPAESKGIHLIDNLTKKSLEKRPLVNRKSVGGGVTAKGDSSVVTPRTKSLTAKGTKKESKSKKATVEDGAADEAPPKAKISGVQSWLAANVDTLKAEHRMWMDKARSNYETTEDENLDKSKRKREDDEEEREDDVKASRPKTSKLDAFSFDK